MKTIKVSDEVWQEIAKRGKFGESEDDVLRRVFELPDHETGAGMTITGRRGRGATRYATRKMHAGAEGDQLVIEFEDGVRKEWSLPRRDDQAGIRRIRDRAVKWARNEGATDPGQVNAVKKALTSARYYVTKKT